MKKIYLFLVLGLLSLASCKKDLPQTEPFDAILVALLQKVDSEGKAFFKMPASNDFSNIPQDPKNPITQEKVTLGQLLFHETALAIFPKEEISKGTYSCASCHFAEGGFAACKPQGIGDGGMGFGERGEARVMTPHYIAKNVDVQQLKTPSSMNGAFQSIALWNGALGGVQMNIGTENQWKEGTPLENNHLGFFGLETQAIAGLKVHRLGIDSAFIHSTEYKALFDAAFPDVDPLDRYSIRNTALAIAAYERTLLASEAPFQKWLGGEEEAMTDTEKKGAIVFFGKGGCVACHTGPALNSMAFYAFGMNDLYMTPGIFRGDENSKMNLGRGGFTNREEDMFKFKTPQLYNLDDSPFYGHGSSFTSILEVVKYKNSAIVQNNLVAPSQLASGFIPLNLTTSEVNNLTAFLKSGLKDTQLKRYVPSVLPSGNCFPNNDPLSKLQMGCE